MTKGHEKEAKDMNRPFAEEDTRLINRGKVFKLTKNQGNTY